MKDGEGERRRNREGKSRYLCSLSDRAHIHQAALGLSPVPARDEVKQTSGKKFTDLALSCQLSLPVRPSVASPPNPPLAAWDCFSTVETEFCRVGVPDSVKKAGQRREQAGNHCVSDGHLSLSAALRQTSHFVGLANFQA